MWSRFEWLLENQPKTKVLTVDRRAPDDLPGDLRRIRTCRDCVAAGYTHCQSSGIAARGQHC
jgi:hypothetical protein